MYEILQYCYIFKVKRLVVVSNLSRADLTQSQPWSQNFQLSRDYWWIQISKVESIVLGVRFADDIICPLVSDWEKINPIQNKCQMDLSKLEQHIPRHIRVSSTCIHYVNTKDIFWDILFWVKLWIKLIFWKSNSSSLVGWQLTCRWQQLLELPTTL